MIGVGELAALGTALCWTLAALAWTAAGRRVGSLPIGFNKSSSGGSCTPGCHLPKDYDKSNPVDYTAWPTEAE